MTNERVAVSKFIALVLRHKSHAAGIMLDENGWTDVAALLNIKGHRGVER